MLDIRPPAETDREAIALLSGLAFNSPARPERVSLAGRLCAYDGARLTASAQSIDFDQWFGGARVACAGIAAVVVQPEDRGRGTAGALVAALLRRGRDEGRLVSALYPTTAALYRKLGYEFAGFRPHFRFAITDLPTPGLPLGTGTNYEIGEVSVSTMSETELNQVAQCFSRFASLHNGPVESSDRAYWVDHALAHKGEGTYQRTVVVVGEGGVTGYASFFLEERKGDRYALVCKHLVLTDAASLSCLVRYFRRFENAAKELVWSGPATTGPLGLVLTANGFSLSPALSRWMMRVVDVPGALEARGYPAVEGEAILRIDDPLFPANNGPWKVRAQDGKVAVTSAEPHGGVAFKPLPIGLFSALYTGLATPSDLILLGALEADDPRAGLLSDLFGGPVPWMPDIF
jgi:predicted acetyltransferase